MQNLVDQVLVAMLEQDDCGADIPNIRSATHGGFAQSEVEFIIAMKLGPGESTKGRNTDVAAEMLPRGVPVLTVP